MLESLHSRSKRQIQHSSHVQLWDLHFQTIETIQNSLAQIQGKLTLIYRMKPFFPDHFSYEQTF